MKKLNVSIFRANFKKEKSILASEKKKNFSDLIDIDEINESLSTIQNGKQRSIKVTEQKYSGSVGINTTYRD